MEKHKLVSCLYSAEDPDELERIVSIEVEPDNIFEYNHPRLNSTHKLITVKNPKTNLWYTAFKESGAVVSIEPEQWLAESTALTRVKLSSSNHMRMAMHQAKKNAKKAEQIDKETFWRLEFNSYTL